MSHKTAISDKLITILFYSIPKPRQITFVEMHLKNLFKEERRHVCCPYNNKDCENKSKWSPKNKYEKVQQIIFTAYL
jgi:hypothetical protein